MSPDSYKNVLEICQDALIKLAELKLGRNLDEKEVSGIRRIHSPMLLEAYENEFNWHQTTNDDILKSLKYFAEQKNIFKL